MDKITKSDVFDRDILKKISLEDIFKSLHHPIHI